MKDIETKPGFDFVEKAYELVKGGTLEHMQAVYRGDKVVVIVRKATDGEIKG